MNLQSPRLGFELPRIHSFTVGFDDLFNRLSQQAQATTSNYPPYNIVKNSDTAYTIEVAVAGFKDNELDIVLEDNVLRIIGNQVTENDPAEYLHRGISSRAFERVFNLAEYVVVRGARVVNGLLRVDLEHEIPKEKLPRKIAISHNT